MAPLKNKCLICCGEVLQKNMKDQNEQLSEQTNQRDDGNKEYSRLKLLSLESLCMLFGLPANHSLISVFTEEDENTRRLLLCNKCLGDLSDIHFVFWQLHNLEVKLIKMQKIMFQRLKSRWKSSAETATEDGLEDVVETLFNDIKSGSFHWPKGVYISRWKEALENVDRILPGHDAHNEVDLTRNVKVEVDQEFGDDTELPSTEVINMVLEDEGYHWDDDKDNKEQLEISKKTIRKSQRQIKSKKSQFFEPESSPYSLENQEDVLEEDENYFIDNLDISFEEEVAEDDDDDPGTDSDYSEILESPKKSRRRKSQGGKPKKINNYQTNSEGKYLCTEDPSICSRTYAVKKLLTKHIKDYHEGRTHICTEEGCPQKFLTEFKLLSHLKNDHGIINKMTKIDVGKLPDKPSFLCTEDPDICSRSYDTVKLLNKHVKAFHEGRNHICTESGCVEKFLTELKLSYHLKRCHGVTLDTQAKPQRLIIDPNDIPDKPLFRCTVDPSICNRIYPQLKFLNGHIKRFHKGRNFICDQEGCVQKFLTQVKLSQHLKLDHRIGLKEPIKIEPPADEETGIRDCDAPHVCEICGLVVPRKLMKGHLTTKHLGYGRFKCDLCGMDFKNGEEIKVHEDLHSQYASTYPFTCVALDCREVLTNTGDLKIHVNKNHLSSGLKCEICGVMKPNQVMLERHVLIHQKERNLICEECGKAYYSKSMLRLHVESSHLGKKVSCEICKKEFLRLSSLKRHRLSHQGVRRFKCAVCPKAFFNGTQRKNHEHTHAGVKNYECHLCGKRFKQKNNLRQHLRTQAHKDNKGKREEVDEEIGGGGEYADFKFG